MPADINIVEFNYSFLKKLESNRNLSSTDIKLKFKEYLGGSTSTSRFPTTNSLAVSYPNILLSEKQRLCMYGDESKIEDILITNNNFPFSNEFKIYNISGTIRIVEKVSYNGYNNAFYESEVKRYKSLLLDIFSTYSTDWNTYMAEMNNCYVVNCYVDINYNCPDNNESDIDVTVYPDLFVDAGLDIGCGATVSEWVYNTSFAYVTTGATHAAFPEATLKWTSDNSLVEFESDEVLNPTLTTPNPSGFPTGVTNVNLTLTVTYPWGPIVTDTKIICVRKYV